MRLHRSALAFVAIFTLSAAACSSSTTNPVPTPTSDGGTGEDAAAGQDASPGVTTHTVNVTNFAYTPAQLEIKAGDTVAWVWKEGTHTVTSGSDCTADSKFDSGTESDPFTFRHTFDEVGTFPYFCDFMEHCQKGQVGTIVVVAR